MKLILISYFVCGAVVSYCAARALPQNFEDPKRYYKPMVMEDNLRGAFNMTPCLRELLSCWETIPPEMVCGHYYRMMSICDLRTLFCQDEKGWQFHRSEWPAQFMMWDHDCYPKYWKDYFDKVDNRIWDAFGGSRYETWNHYQEQKILEWKQTSTAGKAWHQVKHGASYAWNSIKNMFKGIG